MPLLPVLHSKGVEDATSERFFLFQAKLHERAISDLFGTNLT